MTSLQFRHESAISRRDAPERCMNRLARKGVRKPARLIYELTL